jgi:hypothetical protein
MSCDECERVHAEAASRWQEYLTEKRLNQARTKDDPTKDTKHQENLLRIYKVAAARQRVHRGKAHPEKGYVVRTEDLQLIAETGSEV